MKNATTARCSQTRRSPGRRVRWTARTITRNNAPRATRPSATFVGAQSSPSTLMQRKLEPQMAASRTNCACHGAAMRRAVVTTLRRGRADEGVGELAPASPLRVPLQAERELAAGNLDRLGQAVGRGGGHA